MFSSYEKNQRRKALDRRLARRGSGVKRSILRAIAIVCILLVLTLIALLFNYVAQIKYTKYDILRRDNLVRASESLENDLSYTNFLDGMLKISKDGVSFIGINGITSWSVSYNLKNPLVVKAKEYFAIVDRGYGDLYIFGKNGLVGQNKTLLPIMDAAISSYGDLYVILSDDLSSIISVFSREGVELQNKIRTVISSNGYAVGIDCSNDGHLIMAPFTYIDGGNLKSKVCFYYLNSALEDDRNNDGGFAAGFDEEFENTMIGKVEFFDNKSAYAITNENVVFFDIKQSRTPKITKVKKFDKRVKSITSDKQSLAVLFEDGEIIVFDKSGRERKWMSDISYGYSSFQISHGYIYFTSGTSLKIYTKSGKLVSDNEFEDEINSIVIDRNLFTFNILVAFKNSISLVRLAH